MYNSLYIGNRDGGIINTMTQAPQSDDPVVIIGLGGTGCDAVASLKSKLKKQIIPDNIDEVKEKGAEPVYDHIKFLGIDADKGWLEKSDLNNSEILNIQNYNYDKMFAPEMLPALKKKKENQWMSIDYISSNLPPNPNGAGAYRQFGRWLTVSKANNIRMKLIQVITNACTDRNGGALNVHIISGISGGMGAGSFVDVCYITKKVIKDLGFHSAKTFGYFVLPDAIISKEAIKGNPIKTANNQKNGMASLLEIEHLMNLKDSNEWFDQDYDTFRIHTQEKLVDMCHLVSSTNMDGVTIANGYEYALNVVGDYIIAFISEEKVADGKAPITMAGNYANIEADLSGINPDYGYSQNYTIIGSANAEIPTSQMATYLASEIFRKMTIKTEMPNNIQIEQEFADYLGVSESSFRNLERNLSEKTSWIPVDVSLVRQYFDQIKAHMNDRVIPNAVVAPTENSLKERKGTLLQRRETLGKNIEQYVFQAGASSIPGKALNKLIEIAEDPQKGPVYAYGMMNKTGADIFHYLDGRLKYCTKQKEDARGQEANFSSMEADAKRALGNSNFTNKTKRIKAYTDVLNNTYHWQAEADFYEEMEKLLYSLITSLKFINLNYLRPFKKVTDELIETFKANSTYFEQGKGDLSQDGFTEQLVKFSHIKPELDDEINQLDSQAETKGMMQILTGQPEIWMDGDEGKLKSAVSEYILNKFNTTLSKSIETFLRKDLNMMGAPANVFADAIENKVLQPFVQKAAPILWTSEPIVQNNTKTSHRSILSVPNKAPCIVSAAMKYKGADSNIEVRNTLIADRVYILRTISGVPMHAYQGLLQYYHEYDRYTGKGLHLYENDPDWEKILTFPYPYNYVADYTKNANELISLYNEAVEKEIIYFVGTEAFVKQYGELADQDLDISLIRIDGKINVEKANEMLTKLQSILESSTESIAINSKGNTDDNTIVLDNFLRFYGIQETTRKELQKYNMITETIKLINEELSKAERDELLRKVFFDAILVGCFEDDGFNLTYQYVQFGMEKKVILCDNSMPYSGLSKYYQAFQNFVSLEKNVLDDLTSQVNAKFNEMNAKDKKVMVDKLIAMYNPGFLAMISSNYSGKAIQGDIDNFYKEFINYLNNLSMILLMSGVLSNN